MTQEERYAIVAKLWPDVSLELQDIAKAIGLSSSSAANIAYRLRLPARRGFLAAARRKAAMAALAPEAPPPEAIAPTLGIEPIVWRKHTVSGGWFEREIPISLARVKFAEGG